MFSCKQEEPNIHIVGFNDKDAVYLLNGELSVLPKSGVPALASAIVVVR